MPASRGSLSQHRLYRSLRPPHTFPLRPLLGRATQSPLPRGMRPAARGPRTATGTHSTFQGGLPPALLRSGLSLTFSPSSALCIYFYLYRALLICPCYHRSLLLLLSPSAAPCLRHGVRGQSGGGWGGAGSAPGTFSAWDRALTAPPPPIWEVRRRSAVLSSIMPQILLAGRLLPARPDGGGRGGHLLGEGAATGSAPYTRELRGMEPG